ncbi:MAG: hypothetical protein RL380_798 [Verrucomicrobiota bacterium]
MLMRSPIFPKLGWQRLALLTALPATLMFAAPLPNFDVRPASQPAITTSPGDFTVHRDPVTGAARFVSARSGFLTGPGGGGKNISPAALAAIPATDPHRALKAFLNEHRTTFGHGADALDAAQVARDFTTPHNGLRTTVWQQHLAGVTIFESVLIAHTTKSGDLVNLADHFIANPAAPALASNPTLTAAQAVTRAAADLGEKLDATTLTQLTPATGSEQKQSFTAPTLLDPATARLVWLPTDATTLALCWETILASRTRHETYRLLVHAQTGKILLRRCLTDYLSDATYNVYTSDSPSPFSPGLQTPASTQPTNVTRTLITLPALNTNASPVGWISDGGNETRGNNVDAHTDLNADNVADTPRPQGSPARVFNFPLDLNADPTNSAAAAVVQLFYWCNFMHDKLYELGFTEAAGNFQSNNFARGGLGGDAVLADALDGSGVNNANMSTPADGGAPRMQMYVFSGPTPRRDGDLDADIILHEYTHGLSGRLVGGGIGISALQTSGMGEGWSDFYALALLSEPGDDPNAAYAMGGYSTYQFSGLTQNYYSGIRRYPYCTDLNKNPLTFKDIDPNQALAHGSVAISPIFPFVAANANEVHNAGEVWCVTLWELRAQLIGKFGHATGNQLALQLVTDGMKLSPANPNFLEARDAILQADLVDTGGANQTELWIAFAKRGLGDAATSPASSTTTGLVESYSLPDVLRATPLSAVNAVGAVGGPFTPATQNYFLTNTGVATLNWTAGVNVAWLGLTPADGTLAPGQATNVTVSFLPAANALAYGNYAATVAFTNQTSSAVLNRAFNLGIRAVNFHTEVFSAADFDLANSSLTFTPDGSTNFYSVCRMASGAFPTDPTGGTAVTLTDDSFASVTLSGTNTIQLYHRRTNVCFIGSNGYLTVGAGDSSYDTTAANHFAFARFAAVLQDLNPGAGGTISRRELTDRLAVTYQNVPVYGATAGNNFQLELFYDGRLRLTFLALNGTNGVTGLSDGLGLPAGFAEENLSAVGSCSNQAPVIVLHPVSQTATTGSSATFNGGVNGSTPMTYQWRLNGTNLPGATNPILILANLALNQSGGTYALTATNGFGGAITTNATLIVNAPLSLAAALDTTNLVWTTGGTNVWGGQFLTNHDGVDAAESGVITHSQETWLQTTVTNGPGMLTFWWRVSSESGFDYLEFYTNNVLQTGRLSGTAGTWEQKNYYLPGGAQTLRWRYMKDSSVSSGSDRGWVDEVSFVPDVPFRLLTPQFAGTNLQLQLASTTTNLLATGQTGRLQFYFTTNVALAFSNWTLLTNAVTLSNGVLKLSTTVPTNAPSRFFRARQSP